MAHTKPTPLAAELPQKAQTRLVRWMLHAIRDGAEVGRSTPEPGIDGRIVTFHGRSGEAQLKAILAGKDVALYRWKRGLDLELRTALAQQARSQRCGVLTSDTSVIAALDQANNAAGETVSKRDVSLGKLTEAEESQRRDRPETPE